MILDTFKAQYSNELEGDLLRIEKMLFNSDFLVGIGENSGDMSIPPATPIITDIMQAHAMMTSQDVWAMPKPWPYQYFVGEVEDEAAAHNFGHGMTTAERKARLAIHKENIDSFRPKLFAHLAQVYKQQGVVEFLARKGQFELREKKFLFVVEDSFPNSLEAYIEYMIEVAFLAGLTASKFFTRMIELLELGGLPCGWLGGVCYSEGADPWQCMAMLHFGKQAS